MGRVEMALAYSTTTQPVKARFKDKPEDFLVEEIYDGRVLEAKGLKGMEIEAKAPERIDDRKQSYLHFTIEKKDWDLNKIINILARKTQTSRKRFSSCGTKDKYAVTTQRISAFSVSYESLSGFMLTDCLLYDFEYKDHDLGLGDHQGNRFTILLRDAHGADVEEFKRQMEEKGVPNYYGMQRFGMRGNTHEVGKLILKNDFEGACKAYLCDTNNELNEKAVQARKNLAEHWGEYKKAASEYPAYLRYELVLLNQLIQNPNDFANALRRLPKGIFKMFVHAYQSYLFNLAVSERAGKHGLKKALVGDVVSLDGAQAEVTAGNLSELSERVKAGTAQILAPLLGYDTALSGGEQGETEKQILEKEGVQLSDFRIKSMPEASAKGVRRNMLLEVSDLAIEPKESDLLLSFSLKPGDYATSLLRELMKSQ